MKVLVVDNRDSFVFNLTEDLARLGAECIVVRGGISLEKMHERMEMARPDMVLLSPGPGHPDDGGVMMPFLQEKPKVPVLGICLGMQVLAETGDEFGSHDGLGLIPGAVRRLPAPAGRGGTRIPNVGWRQIDCRRNDPLLEAGSYYFVHSYAFYPAAEDDLVATIPVNGSDAPAVVRRGSAIGCQFHPERSGPLGLRLLARFAAAAEENMNERESCNVGG